ncbi:hypothetical protein HYV79_02875 [Candidatus Woesearchaeota archaeon]|nr:hypothetical protein [Candidatus Woesearchaeota archaeon]
MARTIKQKFLTGLVMRFPKITYLMILFILLVLFFLSSCSTPCVEEGLEKCFGTRMLKCENGLWASTGNFCELMPEQISKEAPKIIVSEYTKTSIAITNLYGSEQQEKSFISEVDVFSSKPGKISIIDEANLIAGEENLGVCEKVKGVQKLKANFVKLDAPELGVPQYTIIHLLEEQKEILYECPPNTILRKSEATGELVCYPETVSKPELIIEIPELLTQQPQFQLPELVVPVKVIPGVFEPPKIISITPITPSITPSIIPEIPEVSQYCGNGIKEDAEVCDGSVGCASGQSCSLDCSYCFTPAITGPIPGTPLPPAVAVCGNGVKEGAEVCDGSVGCASPAQCRNDCQQCITPAILVPHAPPVCEEGEDVRYCVCNMFNSLGHCCPLNTYWNGVQCAAYFAGGPIIVGVPPTPDLAYARVVADVFSATGKVVAEQISEKKEVYYCCTDQHAGNYIVETKDVLECINSHSSLVLDKCDVGPQAMGASTLKEAKDLCLYTYACVEDKILKYCGAEYVNKAPADNYPIKEKVYCPKKVVIAIPQEDVIINKILAVNKIMVEYRPIKYIAVLQPVIVVLDKECAEKISALRQ